jgi:hypothetical protein
MATVPYSVFGDGAHLDGSTIFQVCRSANACCPTRVLPSCAEKAISVSVCSSSATIESVVLNMLALKDINMLRTFLYPYVATLHGAAWNMQQNLEGLGITSSNFVQRDPQGHIVNSYWSPAQASIPLLGMLMLFSLVLAVLSVVTGYVLGRKRGAIGAAGLLVLPGCLNLISLWPMLRYLPDRFDIGGTGALGVALGFLPLLFLGVLLGWCLTIVLADLLLLGDRFGHLYDHLWCTAGLVAAVFFIADAGAGEHAKELAESQSTSRQASAYLARQTGAYAAWCEIHQRTSSSSCRWASEVQQTLLDYASDHVAIFTKLGPHTSADIYAHFRQPLPPQEVITLRREIAAYNSAQCPVKQLAAGFSQMAPPSTVCLGTPSIYCTAFADPLDGKIDNGHIGRTTALASECIIPTLVRLRDEQQKLLALSIADKRSKHYRWMYYVFFSMVVGGKIATSTMKLFAMGLRKGNDIRRTVQLFARAARVGWAAVHGAIHALRWLWERTSGVLASARGSARR